MKRIVPKKHYKAGPGRPKGKGSLFNDEMRKEAAKTGETPMQYSLRIMRDPNMPDERRDAMCAIAFPYCHAKIRHHTFDPEFYQGVQQEHKHVHVHMTAQEAMQVYRQSLRSQQMNMGEEVEFVRPAPALVSNNK